MNQQRYDYARPPPPPQAAPVSLASNVPSTSSSSGAPGSGSSAASSSSSSAHLHRVPGSGQPPLLRTNLARPLSGLNQTPLSAAHLVPGSAFAYSPSTPSTAASRTPISQASSPAVSSMEPYNPQQWSRGQVSGSQMVFQPRASHVAPNTTQMTGMEAAMPSPPPPYSPNQRDSSARVPGASPLQESTAFHASPRNEPARQSPQFPPSPAFPPPPPSQSARHRERSASGLSNQRGFFGLNTLRGKQPATADQIPVAPTGNFATQTPTPEVRPPASRRAASTGHMQSNGSSGATASVGRKTPETSWQPGMPLPGPPPGPPPSGSRSQSLNRPTAVASTELTDTGPVEPRRRAMPASKLGPVPPTPADWVDQDSSNSSSGPDLPNMRMQASPQYHETPVEPLRIDTGSHRDASLTRRPAKRDLSAGIRERRSRSRAAKGVEGISSSDADESRPSNLVFSPIDGALSRRREHMRTASALVGPMGAPGSAGQPPSAGPRSADRITKSIMTPPYTPAGGKQAEGTVRKFQQPLKVPGSASSDRPISHILHAPNVDSPSMQAPLSPAQPLSSRSVRASVRMDSFGLQAMERHRIFIEKEAAAATDEERLELFAQFMVHESRLRRDRYAVAYNAMAGDIVDLTRDMWRSYTRGSRRAPTPSAGMSSYDATVPSWASDGQPTPAGANHPSSTSSNGDFTPGTDAASADGEGFDRGDPRQWSDAYRPSLSPIPSMAVSTVPDEDSSRGRAASRWWEQSASGASGSIGRPDRMEKSRRETKYMGVNPATLQADDHLGSDSNRLSSIPGSSAQSFTYASDEYPPEKVGWHEPANDYDTPMATPHLIIERAKSRTPGIELLDVSRLVTLPPPYPRHHPAVNNSHPLLADLRGEHRKLADYTEITQIKDKFLAREPDLFREQNEQMKQKKVKLRAEIQAKIADGQMSFAAAAKAEADFDADESERGKAAARSMFDNFETSVSHPLNTLITDRLQKADMCINRLKTDLENLHQVPDPNQTQEEGDDQPERLEKLTLLKWLFEAREQLHKEMFDLHAMRSDKYSEVILTPYRISKAQSKIDEATAFFKKDSSDRQMAFARDALTRFNGVRAIVEANVTRGVEDQLSAFWDIAPELLKVIQSIPSTEHQMSRYELIIPAQEYDENPSYHSHPLQYLYSLLDHAEKSTYQFIESQTNLLCLLHEVRTATTKAQLRVTELEQTRAAAPSDDLAVLQKVQRERNAAESRLTADLQEKVGEVEHQWREALGTRLVECRGHVRDWLANSGGLDDGFEV